MQLMGLFRCIRSLLAVHWRFETLRLAAADCQAEVTNYPAGRESAPHSHETENWGNVIAGTIAITCDGRERLYRAGDWYRVPRGAVHSARCSAACEVLKLCLAGPRPQGQAQDA